MSDQGKTGRVKLIRIQNILGIDDAEIQPGKVTLIEGGNGTGKTSHLEAIKAAIGGGYDASLVRTGADEGRVVIVLDDETEIEKRIRRHGGGTISARHPDFGSMSAPQGWLNGIVDGLFNPAAFLTSSHRAEDLLEAIPVRLSDEDRTTIESLIEELVDDYESSYGPDFDAHALEALAVARGILFTERTGVNRVAKEKRVTLSEMESSLPDETLDAGEVHEAIAAIDRQKLELAAERDAALEGVDDRWQEVRAKKHAEHTKAVKKLTDRVQELRLKLAKLEGSVDAAETRWEGERSKLDHGREEERRSVTNEYRPGLGELDHQRTRLTAQLEHAAAFANTKRIMVRAEEEAAAAEERGARLSEAITRIDSMRSSVLDDIPIDGVMVEDGEVYVDGVPFPRVNRSKQIEVALAVAKLRAGRLPLVCIDELECLDRETFDDFMAELETSGLQAIITRVTEGPLVVREMAS